MASTNGIRKEFQQLDVAVWNWASNEMKIHGEYPQKKVIQSYALKLYQDAGQEDFKASAGWYHRWRRRYRLTRSKNRTDNCAEAINQHSTEILHADGTNDNVNSRLEVDDANFECSRRKKSCKYDQDFKNRVIRDCRENNILEIAAKYKVHQTTVSIWLKDDHFRKGLTNDSFRRSEAIVAETCENEIHEREREFIVWLQGNNELSRSEVTKKIENLFSPNWSEKSHWFAKYCRRFVEGKSHSLTRIHYSEEFQKLLVNFALRTSQLKTASVFNVPRKQLFNWMKRDNDSGSSKEKNNAKLLLWYKFQKMKPESRLVRKKAKELFNDDSESHFSYSWYYKWCAKNGILPNQKLDEKIIQWILLAYDQNLIVSHHDVQKKALEIYQKQYNGSFKASPGWLLQFCRRYMDLVRRIPPLNIQLPASFENEILSFRSQLCRIISENNIDSESFGVMDEIPLKLKPSGSLKEVERKPLLRSCDFGNAQGSIILSCLGNGVILPPVVILKDKKDNFASAKYHVLYNQTEVLDENMIVYWLDNVWFKHVKQPNCLLLDCFPPHCSSEIQSKFRDNHSFVNILPGGCSSKLNPLTQIVSSQLQDSIDASCKKWYHENRSSWLGGNISLSSADILDWVIRAFQQIDRTAPSDKIRNVFEEMRLLAPEV